MHRHITSDLESFGYKVIPIHSFDGHCWDTMLESCAQEIYDKTQFLKINKLHQHKFHWLGHSMGGLLMRALLSKKTKHNLEHLHAKHLDHLLQYSYSAVTLATPHKGTLGSQFIDKLKVNYPLIYKSGILLGYDFERIQSLYKIASPFSMKSFTTSYPDHPCIMKGCLTASIKPQNMSWPMRVSARQIGFQDPSDGIVNEASQKWNQHIGHFELDHIHQIGFNFYLNPKTTKKYRKIYLKMIHQLDKYWKKAETETSKTR